MEADDLDDDDSDGDCSDDGDMSGGGTTIRRSRSVHVTLVVCDLLAVLSGCTYLLSVERPGW